MMMSSEQGTFLQTFFFFFFFSRTAVLLRGLHVLLIVKKVKDYHEQPALH